MPLSQKYDTSTQRPWKSVMKELSLTTHGYCSYRRFRHRLFIPLAVTIEE